MRSKEEAERLLKKHGSAARPGSTGKTLDEVRRQAGLAVSQAFPATGNFRYNSSATSPAKHEIAPLAQLDRASGYEPEGREFESLRAHHLYSSDPAKLFAMKKNILRAVIEVGFIIFLFYSNLLMGEFERSGMGRTRGLA